MSTSQSPTAKSTALFQGVCTRHLSKVCRKLTTLFAALFFHQLSQVTQAGWNLCPTWQVRRVNTATSESYTKLSIPWRKWLIRKRGWSISTACVKGTQEQTKYNISDPSSSPSGFHQWWRKEVRKFSGSSCVTISLQYTHREAFASFLPLSTVPNCRQHSEQEKWMQ